MSEQRPIPLDESPTIPAHTGLNSSMGMMEFGVKIGQYIIQPGPTEWLLDKIPDGLAGKIRSVVGGGMKVLGNTLLKAETHLQEAMNGRVFMNTLDPETGQSLFEAMPENYLESLFPQGKPEVWPQQVVLCTKDIRPDPAVLRKTMIHMEGIAGDVLGESLPVIRNFDEPAAGKTVMLGVFDTEPSILHNANAVLERVEEIRRDPLSQKHMTRAAVAGGKQILNLLTLDDSAGTTVLRADSAEIMRHLMTHGYSQGGNVATDIFRYVRSELLNGDYALAQDANGKQTTPVKSDAAVDAILGGAHIYIIGGADVAYSAEELGSMPPRDHNRSDGDLVITAAVGSNGKQGNYNAAWTQDAPHLLRRDRFMETRGPKKKLLGFGETRDGYHAFLGHGEDDYRTSVVDFSGAQLQDRWLPRFQDVAVVSDIFFKDGNATISFDRGTAPDVVAAITSAMPTALQLHASGNDYTFEIPGGADAEKMQQLNDALRHEDVHLATEVRHILEPSEIAEWLGARLQKLPQAQFAVNYGEQGPELQISPTSPNQQIAAGGHVSRLLSEGLKRAGIRSETLQQHEDGSVSLPLDQVMQAQQQHHGKTTVAARG